MQHRGQPGTHDLALAKEIFSDLKQGRETRVPRYDKAQFGGEGDRVPLEEWPVVNDNVKLVIFEGWCVGFRPVADNHSLRAKWEDAVRKKDSLGQDYTGRLGYVRFEDILVVNEALKAYDVITE